MVMISFGTQDVPCSQYGGVPSTGTESKNKGREKFVTTKFVKNGVVPLSDIPQ